MKKKALNSFDFNKFINSTKNERRMELIINDSLDIKIIDCDQFRYSQKVNAAFFYPPEETYSTKLSLAKNFINGEIFHKLDKKFKYIPLINIFTPKTTKKIKDSFFYISYGLLSHPKNKDVFLIFNKQENIEFYTKNHLNAVTTGGWPHKEKNVFSSWILKRYKKKENIKQIFNFTLNHYLGQLIHKNDYMRDKHLGNVFVINKKIKLNLNRLKLSIGHHNYERLGRDFGSYEDDYVYPNTINNSYFFSDYVYSLEESKMNSLIWKYEKKIKPILIHKKDECYNDNNPFWKNFISNCKKNKIGSFGDFNV